MCTYCYYKCRSIDYPCTHLCIIGLLLGVVFIVVKISLFLWDHLYIFEALWLWVCEGEGRKGVEQVLVDVMPKEWDWRCSYCLTSPTFYIKLKMELGPLPIPCMIKWKGW
jgi:hypothetical protein